jgi:hypothetical protein
MKGNNMRNAWIIAACLGIVLQVSGQTSPANAPPVKGSQVPSCEARRAAFAGRWRLDLKRSSMGADHPESNYAFIKTFELKASTLVEKDHEVNVDIAGFVLPERNSTAELVPDHQEHSVERPGFFPGMPPIRTRVTAEWQGDNLIVSELGQSFIGPMATSRRYFLSEDGAELVIVAVGRMT